ncbi:LLM class flavin-dependent oxidoreductase [Microbacterium sp. P5_E9]
MSERAVVSIGVGAAIGPELVGRLAPAIEEAGFHAIWVNDIPGADSLAVLAAAARSTTRLTLAAGVIPVDRRSADQIAATVAELGLPQERLMLGIGAGGATVGALQLVGDAATELRDRLTARIVVGAVGPKMRQLAIERSDGVLLSWLRPDVAAEQAAQARAAASAAHIALYVRTALDPSALDRMDAEMRRYAGIPSYGANFARQGAVAAETVLDASAHSVAERLASYRAAVDEVVLRVITPTDGLDDCLRFIDAAKALL